MTDTATPETLIDVPGAAPAAKDGDFPAATRLLTADGATIVAFRFAKGQRLDDHHAPHPLTAQVIEGSLTFTVEDRDHLLEPGRVLHVPEGVVHSVHAGDRDAVLLLLLSS
ncbi:cupin domain-containing protein [Corynebacterium hansenii]|uniref:Cupin domain-containing protein n=1 Tax=Corynebacterium hansenii TaxID=394964 RepID=A0ABV7ZR61_9CORY|nr:cupin domain-containing protein [Corynebacterium hansenii]WJY99716.1 Cupin domain protein [Corynebacterium hansenii]